MRVRVSVTGPAQPKYTALGGVSWPKLYALPAPKLGYTSWFGFFFVFIFYT
jgi:hypothetical protein